MKRSKFLLVLTIAAYVFLLGPMVVMVGASFTTAKALKFPPEGFTLAWYANSLKLSSFADGFRVSLSVSLLGTVIAMLIGVPAAYAMNRYQYPGKQLLGNIFISPTIIPAIVLGFALLKSFVPRVGGSIYTGLLIGYALIALPYVIRTTSSALSNFDFAIEEAAISLGANWAKAFVLSVVPNIRSGLMSAFILAFINAFNDVSIGVFVSGPGVLTLPMAMLGYAETRMDPTIAAMAVMLMLMTMALMFIAEKLLGVKLRNR